MQESISVGISFPIEYLKKIDKERGDVPRSRYIMKFLEKVHNSGNNKKDNEKNDSLDSGLKGLGSSESLGGL